MDQLVAGVAIAAQQTIHRELPAGFAGVIIGDDDLLIFASGLLRHTVGASGVEDIKLLVQLHDEWAVVIGHHDISLTLQQSVVETLMIFLGKHRRITVLCIVVGRIKIKKCVWPVVLVDDFYAVLVFDDDICQPAGALPNQIEETADIAGFSGKGLGAAAEAVSNQLEKVGILYLPYPLQPVLYRSVFQLYRHFFSLSPATHSLIM